MLKKNLSKKITSAVLVMFFLCGSVAPVCFASNSPKKRPKLKRQSSWMNQRPKKGNSRIVDLIEYGYDEDECYPEEDYEHKKWKKSVLNDDNSVTEGNNFNVNDGYDCEEEEEEEWNERTPNGYRRVGDYLSTTEEENNNLNENDDHIANAEESGTQNGNTATNNDGQNNSEPSPNTNQRGKQGTVTPWHLIVFDDDNNK